MTTSFTYFTKSYKERHVCKWRIIVGVVLFVFLIPVISYSQENSYDEVSIILNVQRIGSAEIPAVIYKQEAYLPVKDVFDLLKIKSLSSSGYDSISGFFINPKATFLIVKDRINYQEKKLDLKPNDIIITETNLYLKSEYFGQIFGLECAFNFRSLSITLTTNIELPAIREMQLELMRKNINQLKGQVKADSSIFRNRHFTGFGIADWSVMSMQQSSGQSQTRLDLALGGMIAGGEANVTLNYNSNLPLSKKQQFYNWRYVNNNSSVVKQLVAGKLFTQSASTLLAPVVGVQFTNTPTAYRKTFGTYNLNSTTEPGWMVELYVNNVLINYVKADASGFFSFEVPLVYGNTIVKLKFYGPWGEERIREENISIPFNFLPVKQVEYLHTTGIVEDGKKSIFSQTAINYGISNHMTIGGGVEYLSSIASRKTMPFMNASFRVASNILVSTNYTHGVKASAILNYHLPANLQLDVQYSKYDKQQQVIWYSYLAERKISLSIPVRGKDFSGYSKLTLNQVRFLKGQNTNGELLLSGVVAGVSGNITTYGLLQGKSIGYAYTNLSLGFRLPEGIRLQPQLRYEYNQKSFSTVRVDAEKNLFNRGFLNLSYQNDLLNHMPSINIGLRYDLSFAQTSFSAMKNKQATTTVLSARGSLWFDKSSKGIGISNRAHVGRGGLMVVPFLDINSNNIRDKDEPKVYGLQLRVNGGVQDHTEDSTIRITGLEAYTKYLLEFDRNSFDNIAWQLTKKTISVEIEPNHIKVVEVPVRVAGEASGTVYLQKNNTKNGLGRIIVAIYDSNATPVTKLLTEPDGYFSYLGLKPGSYTARVDKDQLQKLNMKSTVNELPFTIVQNKDGDVVDGLEFVLHSLTDTLQQQAKNSDQTTSNTIQEFSVNQKQLPFIEKKPGNISQKKEQASIHQKQQPIVQKQQSLIKKYQQSDNQKELKPLEKKLEHFSQKKHLPSVLKKQQYGGQKQQPLIKKYQQPGFKKTPKPTIQKNAQINKEGIQLLVYEVQQFIDQLQQLIQQQQDLIKKVRRLSKNKKRLSKKHVLNNNLKKR